MNISTQERATVLMQALPYIKDYAGKVVVVKYGGNAMIDDELKATVMQDVVLLHTVGIKVVLVHGGGPEINTALKKIGKQPQFIGGLRYTDAETMEVVQMVLSGKINKDLVQQIERHGGHALGLCGLDGGLLTARRHTAQDLGFVGDITRVNAAVLRDALDDGRIPVIATIAGGDDGETYNVNADIAAAEIAAALGAEKLVLMTDVRGLLRDKDDERTLISVVQVSEVPHLKNQGVISGGMIPKIECCVEAVRRGVRRAYIIDGRIPHSILVEMLTDEGIGTMFL